MKLISTIIVLLFVFIFTGCGNHVKLHGRVTFSDDGSPLPVGTVLFEKTGFLARGNLQKDGTYIVGSDSQEDGIPPGNYRVYLANTREKIGEDAMKIPITVQLVTEKYLDPQTSGLTLNVEKTTHSFDFTVDRYVTKLKRR